MHIVLVEPEIPQNTGCIARTCAVTGSSLHLVHPLGFSTEDRYLKRAGLDYWQYVDVHYYESFYQFEEMHKGQPFFLATKKGATHYTQTRYPLTSFFIFGKETQGLSNDILHRYPDSLVRIPMVEGRRSLNLASSVAIILYEALRQNGYPGLI